MANPLTAGTFDVSAQAKITGATIAPQGNASPNSLESPGNDQLATGSQTLAFGTGSAQADILCAAEYSLNAGANMTIDLFANGLPNLFGGDANFRNLRAIAVTISSGGDSAGLTIGNAAANPNGLFFGAVTQTWTIFPSGAPFIGGSPAGVAVTAGARNLKIANNGAVAIVFKLMLAGTSV